jgi:hypothetical protein
MATILEVAIRPVATGTEARDSDDPVAPCSLRSALSTRIRRRAELPGNQATVRYPS